MTIYLPYYRGLTACTQCGEQGEYSYEHILIPPPPSVKKPFMRIPHLGCLVHTKPSLADTYAQYMRIQLPALEKQLDALPTKDLSSSKAGLLGREITLFKHQLRAKEEAERALQNVTQPPQAGNGGPSAPPLAPSAAQPQDLWPDWALNRTEGISQPAAVDPAIQKHKERLAKEAAKQALPAAPAQPRPPKPQHLQLSADAAQPTPAGYVPPHSNLCKMPPSALANKDPQGGRLPSARPHETMETMYGPSAPAQTDNGASPAPRLGDISELARRRANKDPSGRLPRPAYPERGPGGEFSAHMETMYGSSAMPSSHIPPQTTTFGSTIKRMDPQVQQALVRGRGTADPANFERNLELARDGRASGPAPEKRGAPTQIQRVRRDADTDRLTLARMDDRGGTARRLATQTASSPAVPGRDGGPSTLPQGPAYDDEIYER